ncbi:MAG TPA: arsenate reductase ArsC [Thermoanaerobaculaceae bacterium]|nr:arsenate reductase ArsC [Thermoanaerobaculaceae bacterium]
MSQSSAAKRVLILCTGNSCRSQMAEGWVRHDLGDRWEVASAGTHPASIVHPLAVQVMREAGVDIGGQRPKHVDTVASERWDLVVTVCDSAREECPVFPAAAEQIHVGFPDPIQQLGTLEERTAAYRDVRDDIRARLVPEISRRSERREDGKR